MRPSRPLQAECENACFRTVATRFVVLSGSSESHRDMACDGVRRRRVFIVLVAPTLQNKIERRYGAPLHARAVGTPSFAPERHRRVRRKHPTPMGRAQPIAEHRVEPCLRLNPAIRRKLPYIAHRPQPLHPARRHPPRGRDRQREPSPRTTRSDAQQPRRTKVGRTHLYPPSRGVGQGDVPPRGRAHARSRPRRSAAAPYRPGMGLDRAWFPARDRRYRDRRDGGEESEPYQSEDPLCGDSAVRATGPIW